MGNPNQFKVIQGLQVFSAIMFITIIIIVVSFINIYFQLFPPKLRGSRAVSPHFSFYQHAIRLNTASTIASLLTTPLSLLHFHTISA